MKQNSITSGGAAADSSTQPIVTTSADIAVNPMLGDVDMSKLNDKDLLGLGFELMQKSLKKIFDKDAKEHSDYEIYYNYLKVRNENIA